MTEMENSLENTIKNNYEQVIENIAKHALKAGRNPQDVHLVVVSKYQPIESILAAFQAGATRFGENYPEQALPKIEGLQDYPKLEWHMIGHLQTRKARIIADHFTMIHSLDSIHLAEKLNTLLCDRSKTLRALIEVNVSGEDAKGGWPVWEKSQWPVFLEEVQPILRMPGLKIEGLMTMPPLMDDAEKTRPYFKRLRALQEYLMRESDEKYWRDLSIGTSADYTVAIEEGARYVRIGQAILGMRKNIR